MNINIVFGTIKKAGRDNSSHEKYTDKAVITVEGVKGDNKSRRVLFNATAMELLKIPAGAQQSIIFGFVEADEVGERRLMVANADLLPGKESTVVYSTSKNKVSFEETKEKGKAISNSSLHKEINGFLEINENISHEYELTFFGESAGLDLYELGKIKTDEDGKSINDLQVNPLSYTGYQAQDLKDAALDNDLSDLSVEAIDVDDEIETTEIEEVVSEEDNEFAVAAADEDFI
jgi:hypothetical protein